MQNSKSTGRLSMRLQIDFSSDDYYSSDSSDSGTNSDSDSSSYSSDKSIFYVPNDENNHAATENHPQPLPRPSTTKSLNFLSRYRNISSKSISINSLLTQREFHYAVYRKHSWKNGIKRKFFQMTELPAGNVIAGAEFESTSSNIMQISNSRGIICEMNLKTSHKCSVLIGNETTARITRKDGVVKVEQFEIDGIKPKYPLLISQLNKIGALEDAFGKRRAIKSIKNCKLCDEENNEVIAVRKTHRSVLDIDSKYNVSFLTCFVVGIFMFLSK